MEDQKQKKNKNDHHPGRLPSGGLVHCLAGRWKLMVRISLLKHKFGVEHQNKDLRLEILRLVLAFTCVFRPGTKLQSCLRRNKQYFLGGKAQALNCTPVAPVLLLSFGAQSSLGEQDTRSDLGARPRNASHGAGLALKRIRN